MSRENALVVRHDGRVLHRRLLRGQNCFGFGYALFDGVVLARFQVRELLLRRRLNGRSFWRRTARRLALSGLNLRGLPDLPLRVVGESSHAAQSIETKNDV